MSALTFVDSHAHLFFKEYRDDLDAVLDRAREAGVHRIIIPGTDVATSREALELAARSPMIYAAVGIHPHDARKADDAALAEIEAMSLEPRVVAIGEIGLDYHYDFSPRDVQQSVFTAQIDIARRRGLPIVIHSRESEPDTLAIVRAQVEQPAGWNAAGGRGVFHCFPGDRAMAGEVSALGFYVSFPGPVTFPPRPNKPNTLAEVVTAGLLDRMLLETDSPYLTPVPHRGKRNEPSFIPLIAEKIAALTGLPIGTIAERTTRNAETLFRLNG